MSDARTAVEEAADALNCAMISGDRGDLDRLTSDELVYGHANARRENKREFIEGVANSTFAEVIASDRTVTVVDNTAIVYQAIMRTKPGGKPGGMKELCVWMSRGGQWKLVGRQSVRT